MYNEPDHRDPDLQQLLEDTRMVQSAGTHPDRLYDDNPLDRRNVELQEWANRRPDVEQHLDELAQEAAAGRVRLTETQRAKIEALHELREAEAEGRERDPEDPENEPEM